MTEALGAPDIIFFALSLAISISIGLYFANKNKTVEEFMLGGRDQKLLPVSLSMMTSFVSGLTLVGGPAEFYHHGLAYSTYIFSYLISVPISSLILLPVFYRVGSLSVLTYLEHRFHHSVKKLVSVVFIIQMTLYNSVVLYVPSLSLQSILGISDIISIGAVGLSCLLYSTVGGIKAVIWTDFFQAGLMYLSMIITCIVGTYEAGGLKELFAASNSGDRLSLDGYFTFDLHTRHTIFTILIGESILTTFMLGANQIQVQRALSLPSLRLAQLSQAISSLFSILVSLLATYSGMVIYNSYKDCDPFSNGQIDKRDGILIYYINNHYQNIPLLRGIFIAGIFAATLSNLSSFQNSMSALILEDFVKPTLALKNKELNDKTEASLGKLLSFTFGIICIAVTFVVGNISGLLQVALTLFGALGGPLIAAFLMGILTRTTNTIGILTGLLAGFTFGIYVQTYQIFFSPLLQPTKPFSVSACNLNSTQTSSYHPIVSTSQTKESFFEMSYLWLPVFTLGLSIVISYSISILTGGRKQQIEDKYLIHWLHRGVKSKFNSKYNSKSLNELELNQSDSTTKHA